MARWPVVFVLLLAGCAGDDAAQEPAPPAPASDNDLPPELQYQPGYKSRTGGYVNGTDAAYYCDTIANSTVEIDVNKTFDGGAHSHDMWKGQDSLVIFEGRIEDFVDAARGGEIETGSAATFFATPGAVVHPGAGRATFKLEWDASPVHGLQLGVDLPITHRDSSDAHVDYVLDFKNSGDEREIEFNFSDNDPAHAERTLWVFKLKHANAVTDASGAGVAQDLVYQAAFGALRGAKLTWTIHRTYDCLPVDPPHYDYWDGRTEVVVFEEEMPHDTTILPGASVGYWYGWQNCGQEECPLPDNGTIPPGTGSIRVQMEWHNEEDLPTTLGLEYIGADQDATRLTSTWKRAGAPVDESLNSRTWIIDVHPLQTDNPYANKSSWDFRWFFEGPDGEPGYGKLAGTIDWKVEAFRAGFGP